MEKQDITLQDHVDINRTLAAKERRQPMKGFDEEYTDIVDYIIRCTHRIWEEKGMGLCYTHYAHNAVIHTSEGMVYGRDEWTRRAIDGLSAFPDIRLFGDEVIWTGNEEDGFHTSHRIIAIGHNTGYSPYGPPTGRKMVRRAIANCFVKENYICEEWVVRDNVSAIRQLGLDVREMVRKAAERDMARGIAPQEVGEVERLQGQMPPEVMPPKSGGGFDVEDFVKRSYHEIWNWRLFNKIKTYYSEQYLCHSSSDREFYGLGDFTAFILSMLQAFPDAKMSVDHLYWLGNDQDGYRVAVRWTLLGTHDGYGIYGDPTGRRVRMMGITHHTIKHGKFVEEWTVFDEFAVMKQLYMPGEYIHDDIPF